MPRSALLGCAAMQSLSLERRIAPRLGSAGEISYYAFGSGPAVLLVNGLGANHAVFGRQVAHLATRYRCLLWDYRTVGVAGAREGEAAGVIETHAGDAAAILRAEGVDRAAVIGWSLGVQVALQLFADVPSRVAALVLISGGATAAWREAGAGDWLRRTVPRAVELLVHVRSPAQLWLRALGRSPEVVTWARRLGLVGAGADSEAVADAARGLTEFDVTETLMAMRNMAACDLGEVLDTIDVPALVIGGDRDPFTPRAALERLVQRIAGAEYLLLPGGTHYVLLDHAEHVNLRIDKFFAERGFVA